MYPGIISPDSVLEPIMMLEVKIRRHCPGLNGSKPSGLTNLFAFSRRAAGGGSVQLPYTGCHVRPVIIACCLPYTVSALNTTTGIAFLGGEFPRLADVEELVRIPQFALLAGATLTWPGLSRKRWCKAWNWLFSRWCNRVGNMAVQWSNFFQ
jgi:hypothetical protein